MHSSIPPHQIVKIRQACKLPQGVRVCTGVTLPHVSFQTPIDYFRSQTILCETISLERPFWVFLITGPYELPPDMILINSDWQAVFSITPKGGDTVDKPRPRTARCLLTTGGRLWHLSRSNERFLTRWKFILSMVCHLHGISYYSS